MLKMKIMAVNGIGCEELIEKQHYESYDFIDSAKDDQAALELYSELQPELVTLELADDDEDSLSFIDNMVATNPDVKILVISNRKNQSLGIKALLKGANGFLQSPFNPDQFSKAVHAASTNLVL